MSIVDDKSILITGGTGSFGNKFVERLFENHDPKKVIILSRDDGLYNKIFEVRIFRLKY